jgi:regulator of sigma E protease
MALISINLGLMNLIPIPVLDGFHILSAGFEGVRRKPIPVRARTIANYIGIALLLALMISAITNDIFRYFVN